MAERRTSFHESRLGEHVFSSSSPLIATTNQLAAYLRIHGFAPADAVIAAYGRVYGLFEAQTRILAYMDCFFVIGVITLIVAPLALYTRNFEQADDTSPGH